MRIIIILFAACFICIHASAQDFTQLSILSNSEDSGYNLIMGKWIMTDKIVKIGDEKDLPSKKDIQKYYIDHSIEIKENVLIRIADTSRKFYCDHYETTLWKYFSVASSKIANPFPGKSWDTKISVYDFYDTTSQNSTNPDAHSPELFITIVIFEGKKYVNTGNYFIEIILDNNNMPN